MKNPEVALHFHGNNSTTIFIGFVALPLGFPLSATYQMTCLLRVVCNTAEQPAQHKELDDPDAAPLGNVGPGVGHVC